MSTDASREGAQRFIEALMHLERGDDHALERLVGLFTEDAELTNPALAAASETRIGRDAIRHFWESYRGVLGRCRSQFSEVTSSDDAAGLFWRTRSDDGRVDYSGSTLLVFDEQGGIRRFEAHFDPGNLQRTRGRTAAVEEVMQDTTGSHEDAPVHDSVPSSSVSYG